MESIRKAAGENEGGRDRQIEKPQENLTLVCVLVCMCAFKCAVNSERCDMIYDQTCGRATPNVLSGPMTDSENTLKHECFGTELSKLDGST